MGSIPIRAYQALPADALAGKIVIDTTNYDPALHGTIPALESSTDTTSELVQRHLTASRVVKTFNTMFFQSLSTLARPAGAPDRSALPVAGDDRVAKAAVVTFLDAIGYDAVDVGSLAQGWRMQPHTPAQAVYAGNTLQVAVPADGRAVRDALAGADAGPPTIADQVFGVTFEEQRVVEGIYRALGGEVELLDEVLAHDWEDIPMIPGQPAGPAGLKPHIEEFRRSFKDGRAVIHEMVGADGRIAVRGELTGVHRGAFLGVEPTGEEVSIVIHEFHRIKDGRVVRSWHLEDLHGWMNRAKV